MRSRRPATAVVEKADLWEKYAASVPLHHIIRERPVSEVFISRIENTKTNGKTATQTEFLKTIHEG